jgi:N-acetylmuramoyl-L-alanine amidase
MIPRYEKINVFSINGSKYVSIIELCRDYDIDWQWDNFSGILTLKKGTNEAKILVGTPYAEFDGQRQIASQPFRFYRSRVAVPLEFRQLLIRQWIGAKPSLITRPTPYFGYKIRRIVIDPGHGGKDPGAIGSSGIKEKNITLDIARRLKQVLESKGIKVVLTRSTDKFVSLGQRSLIANRSNSDLFISIHVNASRSRRPYGFEVYYFSKASDNIAKTLEVAENASYLDEISINNPSRNLKLILADMIYTENIAVSKELAEYICESTCKIMGLRNRGIKSARFVVLKNTSIPAILVEVGFISNAKEERYLKNSFYRQQIAEGLASSIANYKRVYRLTRK